MASFGLTAIYVTGLLVCGSLNTITMKISFTMSGVGLSGQEEAFAKPWFITFVMFVAMSLALAFDRSIRRCQPCRVSVSADKTSLLIDVSPGGPAAAAASGRNASWSKKVALVSIPAVFDIVATGLCSMGFMYIPASVWQLLRGAEMIFAAFFSVVFLKRKLWAHHWLGISLCVSGIMLVGLASVWGDESQRSAHSSEGDSGKPSYLLLGMGLALGGQVVQAAQVIAEEWLLTDMDLPEFQIVGFEGIWGGLVMLSVAFPVLAFLPGGDNGSLENEWDTLTMLRSNQTLVSLMLVYTFSCATYNMAGIAVTGALSAVHRVMLEAFRTSIVWGFGLFVHYGLGPEYSFGEAITPYSGLEVLGFVVLMLGQAIYGPLIKLPFLRYAEDTDEPPMLASPGAIRNFASPLPKA